MSRGTIMALEKKSAVLLTPGGEFVRVRKLPGYEIGAEVTYKVRRDAGKLRRWIQAGVSAAVLFVFLVSFWLAQPPTVVAYVSMDVNPSVEIGLDEDMHVRKLRAVNPDAEAIIAEVKYKGQDLESVMQAIAARLVAAHLLKTQDAEIVIASIPVKSIAADWETQVTGTMKQVLNEAAKQDDPQPSAELIVTTISVPQEIRKLANEQGVSSGKMAFWLAAESQGHDVSIDKLKQQSLKKIAEEWGGVDKVLGDDGKKNSDSKVWKKRLDDAKTKLASSTDKHRSNDDKQRTDDKRSEKDDKKDDKKDNKKDNKKDDDKKDDDKKDNVKKDDKHGDKPKNKDEEKRDIDEKSKKDDKGKNGDKGKSGSDRKSRDDKDDNDRGKDQGHKSRNERDNRED